MPALRHVPHVVFALAIAENVSLLEAHKAAGYAPEPGNAKRIRNRPDVRARIAELRNEAAEFANVRRVRVVLEVDRVGRANTRDFYDGDGVLIPIHKLPRELAAAVQEVVVEGNKIVGYKLFDKNQANFTLLKYLGGLPEAPSAQTHVSIFNQLSVEDQRHLADALEALPGGQGDAGGEAAGERSASGEVSPAGLVLPG